MFFHGRSLTAKKIHFIAKHAIPGLPDVGKIPPDIVENLKKKNRFSDQLVHTQKCLTETHFLILVGTLRGVDPSKKMRDVRTIHFHPFSRRELRHASEHVLFRF